MSTPTLDGAWRALQSHGHIPQAVHGVRYAEAASAVFRRSYEQADPARERFLRSTAQLMTAAYVRECQRAEAAAVEPPTPEVLVILAAQGIETGEAASVARSHAAIRGRPIRCSMSARRAALVGCAAATAPPTASRHDQPLLEVSHD